jgi:hypothetical protein
MTYACPYLVFAGKLWQSGKETCSWAANCNQLPFLLLACDHLETSSKLPSLPKTCNYCKLLITLLKFNTPKSIKHFHAQWLNQDQDSLSTPVSPLLVSPVITCTPQAVLPRLRRSNSRVCCTLVLRSDKILIPYDR